MKSFTIYEEYYDLITLLTEKEQQEILLAITRYMFEDIKPVLNDKQMKVFKNLKRPLDISKGRSKCGSITYHEQNEIKIKSNENQNEIKKQIKKKSNENRNEIEKTNTSKMSMSMSNVNVNVFKEIINYLNIKTNSNYKYTSKTTQQKINARLNEGYKLNDFIAVIDNKAEEWMGTDWEKYLCPETLFGTKFEKYLNQKVHNKLPSEIKIKSVPNWIYKENKKEKLSEEEEKEMEELMSEFRS